MGGMKYPVRVYEVERTTGAPEKPTPALKTEFEVIASSLENCRRIVKEKLAEEGYQLRTLSFSPEPEPYGSVIVYVWKGEDPSRFVKKKPAKKRQGRQAR